LQRGVDLHMAQLMPLPLTISCSSKIQIGFTCLVPAHLGSPGQSAVKRVCVCVTCRLAAKNRDQLRNPTVGNRVRAVFTFYQRYTDTPSASMYLAAAMRTVAIVTVSTCIYGLFRPHRMHTECKTAAYCYRCSDVCVSAVPKRLNQSRCRAGCVLGWTPGTMY